MFLRELRVTYETRHDLPDADVGQTLSVPRDAAAYVTAILKNEPTEVFIVVCLSSKHGVLCYREVARGGVDSVHVNPGEVFKSVLLANAPAFVVAHNHPSGNPEPSPDDVAITRTLTAGSSLVGLQMLDHIVVGEGRYYSFKEGGRL